MSRRHTCRRMTQSHPEALNRLTIQAQPGKLSGPRSLAIRVSDGWRITAVSPDLDVSDDSATMSLTFDRDLVVASQCTIELEQATTLARCHARGRKRRTWSSEPLAGVMRTCLSRCTRTSTRRSVGRSRSPPRTRTRSPAWRTEHGCMLGGLWKVEPLLRGWDEGSLTSALGIAVRTDCHVGLRTKDDDGAPHRRPGRRGQPRRASACTPTTSVTDSCIESMGYVYIRVDVGPWTASTWGWSGRGC